MLVEEGLLLQNLSTSAALSLEPRPILTAATLTAAPIRARTWHAQLASAPMRLMRAACMTCTAISGSGVPTGTTRTITRPAPAKILKALQPAQAVFCAAAPGAAAA